MKKEEVGIVVEVNGSMAKVRASRHGDCKNCGACPGADAIVMDVQNPLSAKVGQQVAFEMKEINMLQAAFIVYIMPLLGAFIGAAAGGYIAGKLGQSVTAFQVAGGIIIFLLALVYVRFYDKAARNDQKMQPVITKILS